MVAPATRATCLRRYQPERGGSGSRSQPPTSQPAEPLDRVETVFGGDRAMCRASSCVRARPVIATLYGVSKQPTGLSKEITDGAAVCAR